MNMRIFTTAIAVATALTILAGLIQISNILPLPLAYFAIGLLAASITAMLTTTKSSGSSGRRRSKSPVQGNNSKEKGNVKWFSASKGFGFITRDNGEDIFVHFRSIAGKGHRILHQGQRVEFAVTESDKGLQAEDVSELNT